ncbi:hypothetical protein CAP31_05420 [Sulfuriferula sp. AH1]|uniref:DUF3301 domain-containing protein n=1 Tax=Sulfuriferula sp. AH1 TaxID=1985873 RepID=UPI000B3B26AE|nr:DUF3301 domain-containing protein [Sulfuriferula sp. AH1]ARU31176.1 hypothetical protein CAP31_05420 [Sulfuriferula sp. AH1]
MEWGILAIVLVLAWFWLDSMKCNDIAVTAARRAAHLSGVQLLDDTVALDKIRLARDRDVGVGLRRIYRFEFSDTGDNRRGGVVVLHNAKVETVNLGNVWAVTPTTVD